MIGDSLNGLRVLTNIHLTKPEFHYQADRFVEYAPEDWGWMAMCGMGEWVNAPSKEIFMVWNSLAMDPATWEAVKKHLREIKANTERLMTSMPPRTVAMSSFLL